MIRYLNDVLGIKQVLLPQLGELQSIEPTPEAQPLKILFVCSEFYSEDAQENIEIAEEIFSIIQKDISPIIALFQSEPYILDSIEIEDLENIFKSIPKKLGGTNLITTDVRLAWALTKVYSKRDIEKAKQYAKFGLSKLDSSSNFIGKTDFENVLA